MGDVILCLLVVDLQNMEKESMEAKVEGVLGVGGELSGFLYSDGESCLLNGDLVRFQAEEGANLKSKYLGVAGSNDERSLENVVESLSGCFIISTKIDRLADLFCNEFYPAIAIVRAQREDDNLEWLVSGYAIGTRKDGRQSTLWRGIALVNNDSKHVQLGWFPLDKVMQEISVCLKPPPSWVIKSYYGQFPNIDPQDEDEIDSQTYDESPQYVLYVAGNASIRALITMGLMNDLQHIHDTHFYIYAVPGEDYEAADDPRVFWSNDFLVADCKPVPGKTTLTGLQIDLDAHLIYMIVPTCSEPLQYYLRIASQYPLEIADLSNESDSDSDSDVGSLY